MKNIYTAVSTLKGKFSFLMTSLSLYINTCVLFCYIYNNNSIIINLQIIHHW